MWNWMGNNMGDIVEGYIVDTKPPDKIINVLHVLLVGFWHEQCLEEPTPIRDLSYVSNLGKCGNAFPHDHHLPLAVVDFLDCDEPCVPGINDAFIISDQNKHTLLVEHRPIFMDNGVYLFLKGWIQM